MPKDSSEVVARLTFSSRFKLRYAVPAVMVALILLFISLLPLAAEYAAQSWLKEHGVKQAEIENIDLNLFSGKVLLQGLKAGDGLNIGQLALDIDWLPLFKHIVHIRSFELKAANFDVHQDEQEQWQLAEIQLEPAAVQAKTEPAQSEAWLAVVDDLDIEGLQLHVNGKDVQLKLPVDSLQLSLSGLLNKEQAMSAEVKLGQSDFSGFGYQLSNQSLDLTARLLFSVAAEDIAASLRSEQTDLELTGLTFVQDDGKKLAAIDTITLSNVQMAGLNSHKVESLSISNVTMQPLLTGAGSLKLASIDVHKINADLNGQIGFASLVLKQLQTEAMAGGDDSMSLQRLELTGFNTRPGKTLHLKSLGMQGFNLHQKQGQQLLASITQVALQQLVMSGPDKGTIDSLSMNGVKLPASGGKSLGSIGAIVASGATLDTSGNYHLNTLQFDGLNTTLVKQKNGKMLVLDDLAAGTPKRQAKVKTKKERAAVATAAQTEKSVDTSLIIDELLISRGSRMVYRDESVFPPLVADMRVKQFRFAPLDLSGKQDGKLDMLMDIGRQGTLSVKGNVRPDAKHLKTDLVITLNNFDMPGLSGFIESDFGKSIQTGQFNLYSALNISNNKIDAKNKLLIRKLELGSSDQPGKAEKRIGMPVDMALDMLRNNRGDIEMEVPVSGNLDDPNININAIINTALMSSMSTGAMTYAALALQPYGSIILVANLASGLIQEAAKPKLTPIVFAELNEKPDTQMTDYVSKIASLMSKSDKLRLQICGVATRIEGEAISQPQVIATQKGRPAAGAIEPSLVKTEAELLLLAQIRAETVMDMLLEHGIATQRLFSCGARIDAAKLQAKPRVELILD